MIKALGFHFWIWLVGYVRTTYDFYGDNVSRRRSSDTDCGETAMADDGPKYTAGNGLTLVIWENDRGVDIWTEGGEEESGGGGGKFAHR